MRKYLAVAMVAAALVWGSSGVARADVKPFALFGDGMVVQRDQPLIIWGKADPEEKVDVVVDLKGGTIAVSQKGSATADKDGNWKIKLGNIEIKVKAGDAPVKGTITLTGKNTVTIKDVFVGDVWVCSGQSNMEMHLSSCKTAKEDIANSKNPNIRLFTVPKQVADEPKTEFAATKNKHESVWLECGPDTVGDFSGVGYYFGRDLQKALGVPIGLIHSSWGGTPAQAWATRGVMEVTPELKHYVEKKPANINQNSPAALFNGMIAPLQPFPIKGATWYQGESNAGQAYEYRTLFPSMIQSWRDSWKQADLPFYFVQLAPFQTPKTEPGESNWAELCEAQLLTTKKLKHTGMAVITDTVPVKEANDIHPKDKEPAGARLALCALALTYGEKVEYAGPLYESLKIEGDKAVLSFTHLGKGLEAKGEALTGFTVAGEDKKFYNAKAEIKGDKVVVTCDKVEKPVAVRFGWATFPIVSLFNKDGLPATPFRTDDFPITTGPKK